MNANLRFLVPTAMSLWDAELVNGWSLLMCVPTVKHEGGGVGCFAGDTARDLFKIQGTLNQHGYHSILQRYAIPPGLRLVGLSFVFQKDNDPKHTSRLCKGYLTKNDGVLHQMTWPHNHPTSTQLRWFGMSWTTEGRKSSKQMFSICGNSFKTVGKAFQVTLVEGMPRVC